MHQKIKVAVIDDHPIYRDGVVHSLKINKVCDVVAEGASMADAVRIAEAEKPDVMLLDISMPGCGIAAANAISRSHSGTKSIMLTVSEQEENVMAALQAGAQGYLLKGSSGPELVRVVRAVHSGESYVSPGLAARLLTQLQSANTVDVKTEKSNLTPREDAILEQVKRGLTNKEIARNLTVSEKTVKYYMTSIMQKLKVRNRVEAVLLVRRRERQV